jgi:hypothetical protein
MKWRSGSSALGPAVRRQAALHHGCSPVERIRRGRRRPLVGFGHGPSRIRAERFGLTCRIVALDGNGIAGDLHEVFGVDPTEVRCLCAACGASSFVAEAVDLRGSPDSRWRSDARALAPTWEVRTSLGRQAGGFDGSGWLWEISRADQLGRVMIEKRGATWSTDPLDLPEDTRRALETDGRTELRKLLDRGDPPRVIRCVSTAVD